MALVGEKHQGTALVLVVFAAGLHRVDQAAVGNSQGVGVTVLGEGAHFHQGHVHVRPVMALAVEELAAQRLGEGHHGLAHLLGARLARCRECGVLVHVHELQRHVLRERVLRAVFLTLHRGADDGARDEIPVGTAHTGDFILLTACDHHDGRDHHLAQQIALFHVGRIVVGLVIRSSGVACSTGAIDHITKQGVHQVLVGQTRIGARLLFGGDETVHHFLVVQQPVGMHERRQGHIRVAREFHLVGGQAHVFEVVHQQPEALAGIHNHQARLVDRHGEHGLVVERGRLSRARGPEHQHVGVLLAVVLIERINKQRLTAPIPEPHARVRRATGTPKQGQNTCDLRGKGQARAAQHLVVKRRIEVERQRSHEGVERHQVVLGVDELEAGRDEQRIDGVDVALQLVRCGRGRVERDHHRVEMVAAHDLLQDIGALAVGFHGGSRLGPGGIADFLDAEFHLVLGLDGDRDREHGARRQAVKPCKSLLAVLQLSCEMADLRLLAQVL